MSDPDKSVECGEHGSGHATFVCQHLVSGARLGFNWGLDPENPDDPCPDAWCDACEDALQAEGEWNDRSEAVAQISLLCNGCYERARQRNWRQDDEAFDHLLSDAVAYLEERQCELRERFRIDGYERFDWNQDSGYLVFSDQGQAKVVADIQFVGSVSTRSDTWLWAWANNSYLEPVRARTREVRQYGEEHRFLKLASAYWSATEVDGWEMTAVSAFLLGARGGYRSPSERGFTFMIITDIRWAQ